MRSERVCKWWVMVQRDANRPAKRLISMEHRVDAEQWASALNKGWRDRSRHAVGKARRLPYAYVTPGNEM